MNKNVYPPQAKKVRRHQSTDGFRKCDAPNCHNVIAVATLPPKFSGPIYCVLHRGTRG